jgi:hypothetical protein
VPITSLNLCMYQNYCSAYCSLIVTIGRHRSRHVLLKRLVWSTTCHCTSMIRRDLIDHSLVLCNFIVHDLSSLARDRLRLIHSQALWSTIHTTLAGAKPAEHMKLMPMVDEGLCTAKQRLSRRSSLRLVHKQSSDKAFARFVCPNKQSNGYPL